MFRMPKKIGYGIAAAPARLGESPELFAQYLEGFLDEYSPQTPRSLALVRAVAAAAWLLARFPPSR
jgi:hypothetical protein